MMDRIVISADPGTTPATIHYASDRAQEWLYWLERRGTVADTGVPDTVLTLPPGTHAMLVVTADSGRFVKAVRLCHDGHPTLTEEERRTLLGLIDAIRSVAVTG